MVEYTAFSRVVFPGDVDTGLLVQPPAGESELVRDSPCFIDDDSVWPNLASTSRVTRDASYASAMVAPPTTNTSATTPLQARRSPRAVKARSSSARPSRTSSAPLMLPPGPVQTSRRRACGRPPVPRPAPQPAGSAVPRETTADPAPGTRPTPEEQDRVARQDAQPAPPAARPIAHRRRDAALLGAARAEPQVPRTMSGR